jgi:hypothetical protein
MKAYSTRAIECSDFSDYAFMPAVQQGKVKRFQFPLHYSYEREPPVYQMLGGELYAQHGTFLLPGNDSLRVRLSVWARSRSTHFTPAAALHARAVQC